MFRGIPDPEADSTGTIDFYQVFNSFLGMYQVRLLEKAFSYNRHTDQLLEQILSSENWTDVVNTVLSSETGRLQIVLAAIFLSGWMFFGYCESLLYHAQNTYCAHLSLYSLYRKFVHRRHQRGASPLPLELTAT